MSVSVPSQSSNSSSSINLPTLTPLRSSLSTSRPLSATQQLQQQQFNINLSPDRTLMRSSHSATRSSLLSPSSLACDCSHRPYVFLGGSCDPTTWRRDTAIPKLDKYKIPYYNPQIADWHPGLIALEAQAKEECDVLLFVIDSATRAIASMLEAVEYIMAQRNVVLVICDIPPHTVIDGIEIDDRQLKDLNRARAFLCDIAARHQKHCDVFDSIDNAINHIVYSHPSMTPRMNSFSSPTPAR